MQIILNYYLENYVFIVNNFPGGKKKKKTELHASAKYSSSLTTAGVWWNMGENSTNAKRKMEKEVQNSCTTW